MCLQNSPGYTGSVNYLWQKGGESLEERVHDEHGREVNHDGGLDVLDVDVHCDEGDDEDGTGGQVDGDDVVGQLPLEGHHKDGGPLVIGSGGNLYHDNYDVGDDDEDVCCGDLGDGELGQVGHSTINQRQRPQLIPVAGTKLNRWCKKRILPNFGGATNSNVLNNHINLVWGI